MSEQSAVALLPIAGDPRFLGYAFACFQRVCQLSNRDLALMLGIDVEVLGELAHCPRPWPDPYQIRLFRLAEAYGVYIPALARMLAATDQSLP